MIRRGIPNRHETVRVDRRQLRADEAPDPHVWRSLCFFSDFVSRE
jgi:hypothetical protein